MSEKEKIPKFSIGQKVKVIKYGHVIWHNHSVTNEFVSWDICPEIVGKEGIIDNAHITQNIPTYSIFGIPEKTAWYNEDQLELIK